MFESPIMTLVEAARYLRIGPDSLRELAVRGEVRGTKYSKGWRFHRNELDRWINKTLPQALDEVSE